MSLIAVSEKIAPTDHEHWPRRVDLFGISIDCVTMAETLSLVRRWISEPQPSECRYIVTPNVDHIVMLQKHAGLKESYRSASLVLADGWPVVTASRWLGKRLPERVPGSDLVPKLFAAADAPLRAYLLGAAPGVGVRAAANIQQRWPAVKIVGVDSPPLGFEHNARETEAILARVADAKPDFLVVGLGAPKQELWVHGHRHALQAKVAICAGATIDFLAGEKKRAPRWMQRLGLEWLHRMGTEPRRLVRRYLKDGLAFPSIVWRESRGGNCAAGNAWPNSNS